MLYSKARQIYADKLNQAILRFATKMRWTNDWELIKKPGMSPVMRKTHELVIIDREQIDAREMLQRDKKAAFEWFMNNTAPETKKAVSVWFTGNAGEKSFY